MALRYDCDVVPQLRMKHFGSFGLTRGDEPVRSKLQSTRKLLAILAMRPRHEWSRTELAALIWPDADEVQGRTSLRTALVEARSILGTEAEIVGDKDQISLDPGLIDTDLGLAKTLQRRIRISSDELEEERLLFQLADVIGEGFLIGWDDEWVEGERREWNSHLINALVRLGAIALEREDYGGAAKLGEKALVKDPYFESAWGILLQAEARLGHSMQVSKRFRSVRDQLKSEVGSGFSGELNRLAQQVFVGSIGPATAGERLDQGAAEVMNRTISRFLVDSPEDALRLLGSDSFRPEVLRAPQEVIPLLLSVIEATTGTSEARRRCVHHALFASGVLNRLEFVFQYGPWLIEHEDNPARLRSALSILSFSHFHVREWDLAYKFGREAVKVCEEMKLEAHTQLARTQLGSYDWHRGEFESALQGYLVAFEDLTQIEGQYAMSGSAAVAVNIGFVYSMTGRYGDADEWFQRANRIADAANYQAQKVIFYAAHGACQVMLGRTSTGIDLIVNGLGLAYRQRDERSLEIGFDYAALALAQLGHRAEARALLDLVEQMREKRRHTRSVAEQGLKEAALALVGAVLADEEWLDFASTREVFLSVLDLLS